MYVDIISWVLKILETQLKFKEQQVQKLGSTADDLKDLDPETQEKILSKKTRVEERFDSFLMIWIKFWQAYKQQNWH